MSRESGRDAEQGKGLLWKLMCLFIALLTSFSCSLEHVSGRPDSQRLHAARMCIDALNLLPCRSVPDDNLCICTSRDQELGSSDIHTAHAFHEVGVPTLDEARSLAAGRNIPRPDSLIPAARVQDVV